MRREHLRQASRFPQVWNPAVPTAAVRRYGYEVEGAGFASVISSAQVVRFETFSKKLSEFRLGRREFAQPLSPKIIFGVSSVVLQHKTIFSRCRKSRPVVLRVSTTSCADSTIHA